ncbi:MAG: hypothetical protein V1722_04115 [Candidatus Micrarchaeota archaeon]
MSLLNRSNIVKAFAILLIAGFVIELFIVYMYQQPQSTPGDGNGNVPSAAGQVELFSTGAPSPFVIRSFTGSMLFTCSNSSIVLPVFPELLGKPVQTGTTQNETIFLARVVNVSSLTDGVFLRNFSSALKSSACGKGAVFREASVVFNSTIVSMSDKSGNVTNVSKRQLDFYEDQLGRGPIALVSDSSAGVGSVVEAYLRVVSQGELLVPGSLLIEQPFVPQQSVETALLNGVVSLFTGKQVAVVSLQWENRSIKPSGFTGIANDDIVSKDFVVLQNVSESVNASMLNFSFVTNVEKQGSNFMLYMGNFSDRAAVERSLTGVVNVSLVSFPSSRYFVEFNGTMPALASDVLLTREANVTLVNTSIKGMTLPYSSVLALVAGNTSIGETVELTSQIFVNEGQIVDVTSRESSVQLPQ